MQNIKANKIIKKLFPYNYSVVSDDNESNRSNEAIFTIQGI